MNIRATGNSCKPSNKGPPVPHLGIEGAMVVKASIRLTDSQKLVWLETHTLESVAHRKGDWKGCFASAGVLAERLGKPSKTVESNRDQLKKLELLHCVRGRRIAFWYPTLPPHCVPKSRMPDEIFRCRVLLDEHITDNHIPAPAQRLKQQANPRASAENIRVEGRGEVPHPTPEGENPPPLSPPPQEEGAVHPKMDWNHIPRGDRGAVLRGFAAWWGSRS